MLYSLLSFLFNLILFLLTVLSWAVLIYVVMALFAPQSKYTLLIGKYVEPILTPIRTFINRLFPSLAQRGIDFSPLGLYVLIIVASWLVKLLYRILL